ncbi:hypothetical protein HYH03_009405 [Edaphochlamys debaryana]|uniref:Sulfatase N-terminal domain-containing protein n=1 Tax=Edaphochlamys debaryana TaxID=47281 RepID=A0A835XZ91_9CHLO|nr:hypothetical protein HYH03_009405 [Edaphochlamys debaryana]|eukprot:KAG2492464.1 hypothetical protein HYH03_009405 [Edaphochlamys debaryana]
MPPAPPPRRDDVLNSTHPHYMPALHRLLGQGGTRLSNFLVSTGVCCPARTSLLTGRLAHCTNVTTNFWDMKEGGGFRKFYKQKLDTEWLPTLLTAGGYDTYLVGKFLNDYFENATYFPPNTTYKPLGWKSLDALTYGAYDFWNSCYSLNGAPSVCLPEQYQTDTVRDKALKTIADAPPGRPFFLAVTPVAPHRATRPTARGGIAWYPPAVAPRHRALYANDTGVQLPEGPNYRYKNTALPKTGPTLMSNASYAAFMRNLYLARLRSLRAVDEMLDDIVQALDRRGVLNNTYVIFASDNGYHLGAFGLWDGKNTPIEEDVRVPFLIRGPNIPVNTVLPYQGNMVDVAPTILALAGLPIPDIMDGLPLPLNNRLLTQYAYSLIGVTDSVGLAQPRAPVSAPAADGDSPPLPVGRIVRLRRDAVILEGWNGERILDSNLKFSVHYKGLRLCLWGERLLGPPVDPARLAAVSGNAARAVYAPGMSCYKYIAWCQGPRELYDLSVDPYEVDNRIANVSSRVLDRLDAVLSALVHCRGTECRSPYGLLHPGEGVYNFTGTLDPRFDAFYAALPKLRITQCNALSRTGEVDGGHPSRPPNFLLVLTDDQDDVLNSTHPHYMPALHRLLGQGGTRLSNFLVSTGVCCPARTSLLTGRLAHCTNVTSNYYDTKQGGGFRKFYEQGLDRRWLPTLLEREGYDTYLVGKFLNDYYENATFLPPKVTYRPLGMTRLDALTWGAYDLTSSCYSLNGAPSTCLPGAYQTDTIRDRGRELIASAAARKKPFFLALTPTAPHLVSKNGRVWSPPNPPARHQGLYAGENIMAPCGPNCFVKNPNLPKATVFSLQRSMNSIYLGRIRSLRAVDELIDAVVQALDAAGVLDNTYVLFSSDNGYHLGAFGLLDGKNTPIEEDVRVPLYVRGPGIPAGAVLPYQGNMVDLAPTILALAGLPIPDIMDGLPLPLNPALEALHSGAVRSAADTAPRSPLLPAAVVAAGAELGADPTSTVGLLAPPVPAAVQPSAWSQRDVNILEGWNGERIKESKLARSCHYKSLRLCTGSRLLELSRRTDLAASPNCAARFVYAPRLYCYKYTVWCQGGRELYDLSMDPYEIDNRIANLSSRVLDRLDAVLSALVHCRGTECRSPYGLLHPGGGVYNFTETLDPRFDAFYAALPKLRIAQCNNIYIKENELTSSPVAVYDGPFGAVGL